MPRPQQPPPDDDDSFGARLIRYRLKKGLSRKQVAADLCRVAPTTQLSIRRWENEGRLPRDPRHYNEVVRLLKRNNL